MQKEEYVPVISTTELHEKLQSIDDHTILTIILDPPEGVPADAES